jgi:hypothetical protein
MIDHRKVAELVAIKDITPELKQVLNDTKAKLKGRYRRQFMAKIVSLLGPGGQYRAEQKLGWDRTTIRKGSKELESGIICIDNFFARGRKRAEDHFPTLLDDIKSIVAPTSQADPTFRTTKLYTPITAGEVQRRLIEDKQYPKDTVPKIRTIRKKLNELNFHPQKVGKTKPKKK